MGGQFALWLGDDSRAGCDTKKPQPFTAAAVFPIVSVVASILVTTESEKGLAPIVSKGLQSARRRFLPPVSVSLFRLPFHDVNVESAHCVRGR